MKSQKMKKLNLMFMSLLLAGMGMAFTACSSDNDALPSSIVELIKEKDRNPMPKGSYYTQFELNLNAQGKTPSEGSKGIVCKKSFTIE